MSESDDEAWARLERDDGFLDHMAHLAAKAIADHRAGLTEDMDDVPEEPADRPSPEGPNNAEATRIHAH